MHLLYRQSTRNQIGDIVLEIDTLLSGKYDSNNAIFYGEVEIEGKTFLHNAGNQTFNLPVVKLVR